MVFAQDEAWSLRHNYIGTEHLLLGLLRENEGIAARVLQCLDITLDSARAEVVGMVGRGEEPERGQIPLAARSTSLERTWSSSPMSVGAELEITNLGISVNRWVHRSS
jgi:ATP-dependent Clp protease ATP-binding subunit ClpC